MFRLGGHAEPFIKRLWIKTNRLLRTLFLVEQHEEPLRTRVEQHPRITKEQTQTLRKQVEARPRIDPREKAPVGSRPETSTSSSLKKMTRIDPRVEGTRGVSA